MRTHDISPIYLYSEQGKDNDLSPVFDYEGFKNDLNEEVKTLSKSFAPIPHKEVLRRLLEQIEKIDFKARAFPDAEKLQDNIKKLEHELSSIGESGKDVKAAEQVRKL